jgi:hypothetical protein
MRADETHSCVANRCFDLFSSVAGDHNDGISVGRRRSVSGPPIEQFAVENGDKFRSHRREARRFSGRKNYGRNFNHA